MTTKEYILSLLENKRGQYISGALIAEQLNVSRNAVWKAIKELEKDGHVICASTNKGYCYSEDNDILSVQGMLPYLSDKKNAERIKTYKSLQSTNKTAKEMAVSGAEHCTVIIADSQTEGKGRFERRFFSPPGQGIYMSFVMLPRQLWFDTLTLVTAFAAVSVCEAIEAVSEKKPKIKWVNDILLDNRKICGISTEAVSDFESGSFQWIVLGIGVNFNTPSAAFPEDLRQIAGSVFFEGGSPITRNHLAAEIVNRITAPEKPRDEKRILEKYKSRLSTIGEKITVLGIGAAPYEAIAVGIDDIGRLIVKKSSGETLSLSAGEISIRNK